MPLNGIAAMVQVMISTTYCILQFGKRLLEGLGVRLNYDCDNPFEESSIIFFSVQTLMLTY